ncbi:MAG: 3'-5' exonuclease [Rhizobiaceae bacterium]|nr:3'-5' exonuclease [Rhizobiaceae bacterium]
MMPKYDHFWVVDVEGNGANPPEIIELAMVELRSRQLTGKIHHWFIKPSEPISHHVTRVHGITNEDVAREPSIEDIEDDVCLWLEGVPIIGHNVKIEVDALKAGFPHWVPVAAVDTLKLAKKLKPSLASYSLQNLGDELGLSQRAVELTDRGHHSALYDATLTALLFIDLLKGVEVSDQQKIIVDADILNLAQGSLL